MSMITGSGKIGDKESERQDGKIEYVFLYWPSVLNETQISKK